MPVSPYISQTTYTSRPYPRSNSSNITTTTITGGYGASKYYGGDTTSIGSSLGYKAGGYTKSKSSDDVLTGKPPSALLAGRYKPSEGITESQTLLELRLKKSGSNSSLFSGNTANILKNFGKTEDKSRVPQYLPPKAKYSDVLQEERKFYGKSGGVSVFANQYLARVNRGKDYSRPREIDTRDINTTDKPKVSPGFYSNDSDHGAPITRNSRHVVRLTIKREELDPFVVKDKTIKTIAQRLIEKYTDKEKKPDPYDYVPRKRLYEDSSNRESRSESVLSTTTATTTTTMTMTTTLTTTTTTTTSSTSMTPAAPSSTETSIASEGASKDPSTPTSPKKKKSLADLCTTKSPQSSFDDEGDVAAMLLRATSMAVKKKELENSEEVKDAIIAAVLHPDVDIESDEEMKELVQDGKKGRDKWQDDKDVKEDDKYNESSGDHSDEGKTIVGQLKRFVKKQISTKVPAKRSSKKKSRSSSKGKKSGGDALSSPSTTKEGEEQEQEVKTSSSLHTTKTMDDDSLLSADLIFGASKQSKPRKPKHKSSKSSDGEIMLLNGEKRPTKENKKKNNGLALLTPDLVYTNLTSDEENNSSRPRTPLSAEKTVEDSDAKPNIKEDEKKEVEQVAMKEKEISIKDPLNKSVKEKTEKPASKIPRLKKKAKKASSAAAEEVEEGEEEAKEALPEIKVSSVGSPSVSPPKGIGETEEKVRSPKEEEEEEVREPNTPGGINKKISSKTSTTTTTTKRGIETSDHSPLAGTTKSRVESKNSIPGKEIKSVRSEKSSPDDKREKLPEEKSISEVSAELKTSKKSRVREEEKEKVIAQGNKEERALKRGEFRKDEGGDSADSSTVLAMARNDRAKEVKGVETLSSTPTGGKVQEGKIFTDDGKIKELLKEPPCLSEVESVKDKQMADKKISLKKKASLKKLLVEITKKSEEIKEKEETGKTEVITAQISTSPNEEKEAIIEVEGTTDENKDERGTKEEEEVPQADSLAGKKAIKRPRQVGPAVNPPPQENKLGNADLLNMRKILKRPVKKAGAAFAAEEKPEEPSTPEDPSKKLWKRPIAQLVPPKEGDQFLQARNVLKKPVKTKPPPEDKNEKPTGKLPDVMKKFKKPGALAQKEGGKGGGEQMLRSRSPSTSDEEGERGEGGAKKGVRQKRPLKSRPSGDKETTSSSRPDSPSASAEKLKDSEEPESLQSKEENTSKVPTNASHSGEPESLQSTEKKSSKGPTTGSQSSTAKLEGSGKDPKLSACQSADSGYGSSPSTPQPTQTAADIKNEEICTVCGTNCHKKCEKQMANLCGVNQKLLAEALSSVKKAGSADGTNRTMGSPTKGSSVSGSESETTEDESETDTDTDYFGLPEIRAPLQTKPKFKKYTIDDFVFVKVLGKGSYGKVMLAQQKDSDNYFAVKCLKKDVVLEDNDIECTLIERKVLSLGTKHPYLCHLFCTFQTPSHLFFVMEYLTGGDLMFHIQHCGRFDEFRACFYAAEITSGLKFLHSKGIIYRDLKLDNILLDYQGHIRIADFGMCKLQVYLDRYADTFCGTPDYMAPEVIKGQHYNQCVDWWSFGVLLYEMLTGKSPFKGCDEDHLFWLICNDEPFFPKFLSLEATEILKGLLDKDSTRRLGIPFSPYGEIKDHAFFKYIDWCKIERKEVETPYKPRLRHILDVQYFDKLFTKRHAALTPLDESILATMDQTAFTDFSYTNPNITD